MAWSVINNEIDGGANDSIGGDWIWTEESRSGEGC
jgi:hypothetical protein